MKKTSNKKKPVTPKAKTKKSSEVAAYSFGDITEHSFEELLGSERGNLLQVFGQVCNCGMSAWSCDPYNCGGYSDNRC